MKIIRQGSNCGEWQNKLDWMKAGGVDRPLFWTDKGSFFQCKRKREENESFMEECLFQNQFVRFDADMQCGTFSIDFSGGGGLHGLYSEIILDGTRKVESRKQKFHETKRYEEKDVLGASTVVEIAYWSTESEKIVQKFRFCEAGYMTVSVRYEGSTEVSTNYICPIKGSGVHPVVEPEGGIRMLAVPFDNDKWTKFVDYPAAYAKTAYEFTALHREGTEEGIVLGSLNHDTWKTGIDIAASENGVIREVAVVCGKATEDTRDLDGIGHGHICGNRMESAAIFLGYFPSFQNGFRVYGECNAKIAPMLPWKGPVIFGWNSWSAYMGELSLAHYKNASDFMRTIKSSYSGSDGNQYINFDAFWDRFSNKMQEAVEYVKGNGQMPGTYFCPFITGGDFDKEVPGTEGDYFYRDILLRDKEGEILPPVDGLYSLDPTHPGTLARMEYEVARIIRWGFRSIKTDFLSHGSREGCFYDKGITTGIQAYCFGMKHFVECVQKSPQPIFISLSIAPIFPHGYGHARRISCDAFGTLDQSAYLNNCITYLWWMNDCLYRFNDPDHIVLFRTYDKTEITEEEAKTRFLTGVICGSLMLTSDAYENPGAQERAKRILTDEEINQVAGKGESFYPLSGASGEHGADIFIRQEADGVLAALFNYSLSEEKQMKLSLGALPLLRAEKLICRNLWNKSEREIDGDEIAIKLKPAESVLLKIQSTYEGGR